MSMCLFGSISVISSPNSGNTGTSEVLFFSTGTTSAGTSGAPSFATGAGIGGTGGDLTVTVDGAASGLGGSASIDAGVVKAVEQHPVLVVA